MNTGRPATNEVGNVYGKLTVIEKTTIEKNTGAKWICLCECGNTVIVRGTQLRKNAQTNCGCEPSSFVNLAGRRFGSLVVVRRLPNIRKNATRFLCVCDCGKEVGRLAKSLQGGDAVNCGCRKELPAGEGAFRALYRATKFNAGYRGIEWNLDEEFFRCITQQLCCYCGIEPYQVYEPKRKTGGYTFNGIDRVDNDIGYIKENCVPCCGVCNYMKSATNVNDFRDWIVQIYNHWATRF